MTMGKHGKEIKDISVDEILRQVEWPAPPAGLKQKIMARLDETRTPAYMAAPLPYKPRVLAALAALVMMLGFGIGLLTSSTANATQGYSLPYSAASTLFMEVFKA